MPSRGPIGFAVRDVTGRGCASEIDEAAGEALVFGSASPLRVSARGVMPAHFVVLPHDGVLMAASASAETPAILNGQPLPTSWTVLDVPSRIRVGAAAVDFFFVRESGVVLVDQDIETTVADSGSTRIESAARGKVLTPPRPSLPPLLPPPMRGARRLAIPPNPALVVTEPDRDTETTPKVAFAGPSTSGIMASPRLRWLRTLRVLAQRQLHPPLAFVRMHWDGSSMSTRVLLGMVVFLLLFVVARSGHEPRTEPTAPTVTVVPTAVPMAAPSLGE